MKKIFTLAIALYAAIGAVCAQDADTKYDMYVTDIAGNVTKFRAERVDSMVIVDRPGENDGWTSLGYCLYSEDLIASVFCVSNDDGSDNCDYFLCQYYVEIQEKDDTPGYYRMVDPYGPDAYPFADHTTINTSQPHWYVEIDATVPDGVFILEQHLGISWGNYGKVNIWSEAGYWMEMWGLSFEDEYEYGDCGTMVDGKITFPYSYVAITLRDYDSYSGYFEGNLHEAFLIDLNDKSDAPGPKDAKVMERAKQLYESGEIVLNKAALRDRAVRRK